MAEGPENLFIAVFDFDLGLRLTSAPVFVKTLQYSWYYVKRKKHSITVSILVSLRFVCVWLLKNVYCLSFQLLPYNLQNSYFRAKI